MAEVYRKRVINYKRPLGASERAFEVFEVSARSHSAIRLADVVEVVDVLSQDLDKVQPPLEGSPDSESDITIETNMDPGYEASNIVTATFLRGDATTTNTKELGYESAGYPILNNLDLIPR